MSDISGWKIALVGPIPPPSGGMANQTEQLASFLQKEGVSVDVIRVNSPYRPAWASELRGVRALFRLVPYMTAVWRAAARVDVVHVMANSGWSWHLFAAPAIWIAWLRRKPAIINYRGGAADTFFAKSWKLVRPTIRRARAVIVPSTYLKAVFDKRGINVTIVPNIIDLNRFTLRRPSDKADHPDTTWPHVVVTRNLEKVYDIATALRAFARIRQIQPSARLSVAGSGPERNHLERLAGELEISSAVVFTGHLGNAEIASLYRSADLMLNPSLIDNMPISILEALASGVPVVSTDVGGVPHLVRHGETALLVPPGDPAGMAEAVRSLLEDPGLAERLVKAGLVHVRQFGWEQVRERLVGVYHEAQRNSSGGNLVQQSGR